MNTQLISFIAVVAVVWAAAVSLVVLIALRMIRNERNHPVAAKEETSRLSSRVVEDLRGVWETVVAFFARTESFRGLLERLAGRPEPMPLRALLASGQRSSGATSPVPEKVFTALFIMRGAGLLHLTEEGVVLTDVGREIYRRITAPDAPVAEEELPRLSAYDSLFVPVFAETSGSSHRERVHAALNNNGASVASRNGSIASPLIGQLRKPSRITSNSTESLNAERTETTPMKPNVIMTATDHEELTYAIAGAGKLSPRGRSETSALERELARAEVVDPDRIPADVITMNSRAELLDLDSGERMKFTLVFPVDADIEVSNISVLAPLGTAMLGYRVGDEFTWNVPYGERHLKVTAVHFQPEAATLAMAA
jgi:regulator of nucleoside diphosphate kinase